MDAPKPLRESEVRKGLPVRNKALMGEDRRTIGIVGKHGINPVVLPHQERAPTMKEGKTYRQGSTMILVWRSGLARSLNAAATPSMPTVAVTSDSASTWPSAIRRSAKANSSGV